MKKKCIALLIMLILLLSMGLSAFAEGDGGVQKGDIVYLGTWNEQPIRWIVLDPERTNAGTPGVFLLTEQALTNQGVVYSWAKAVWQGSEGQAWCQKLFSENLSELEQAAVPAVSKSEEAFQQYGLNWGAVSLEEEQLFFISTKELVDYIGPNDGDPGLSTTYVGDNKGTYYWLRTPHGAHADYAGLVLEDNQVHDFLVYGSWGTRPATNLGGDGFLYLAPAQGTISGRAIGPMPSSDNGEWKVTAVDPSMHLNVDGTRYSGGQLTVNYSDAPANAWLSVLVRDAEGNNLSYGCLEQTAGGMGSVSFIPDLPEGAVMYLFAEKDNGPQNANSASPLCELSWELEPDPTPTPEPTPVPVEEPEEGGGSISLVSVSPLPVDPADSGLKPFLRQYYMFAIPFAMLSILAIAVAIFQAVMRRREDEYEDDYYYYEEDEDDEDDEEQ